MTNTPDREAENTAANFWPGLPFASTQIIACDDGEKIMGPFGQEMTVRRGRAVRRGGKVFMERADYEALAQREREG